MFVGNIHAEESLQAYPQAIQQAISYLKENDLLTHAPGRYELDGDKLILQVIDMETAPRAACRAEVHRRYIDVQFLAKGEERIHCYPDLNNNEVEEALLEARDIIFYRSRADVRETVIEMTEGTYAVFFPSDVHIPGIQLKDPAPIRKVVLKVRLDTLE